jgi:hypothetical protein
MERLKKAFQYETRYVLTDAADPTMARVLYEGPGGWVITRRTLTAALDKWSVPWKRATITKEELGKLFAIADWEEPEDKQLFEEGHIVID